MVRLTPLSQKGASHIIAVLAIVVIGVAGFVGYKVMNNEKTASNTDTAQSTLPEQLKTKQDIDQASTSLDEFDSDLNPEQLDADLNSLL